MAQRLAKIVLFKNRQQMQLSCNVNLKGFTLQVGDTVNVSNTRFCLLYTSPSPRDRTRSRMPSSA